MRGVWLLAVLLGLAGCASSTVKQQEQSSAVADARARLGMGQCNMNLAQQVHQLSDPQLDLEAAYLCLQQGQLPPLELVLEDFAKRHPDAPYQDYASYLQAMVPFARFSSKLSRAAAEIASGTLPSRCSSGKTSPPRSG